MSTKKGVAKVTEVAKSGGKIKSALEMIDRKHAEGMHSPHQQGSSSRKKGVNVIRITQDNDTLAFALEGAFRAREFVTGKVRDAHLIRLAPSTMPPLRRLPITGHFWKKADAEALVGGNLDQLAPYMVSCTTAERGSGQVLLFTVTQAKEVKDQEIDFHKDVYLPLIRYFEETKEPPTDNCALQDVEDNHLTTLEDAKAKWNLWHPWNLHIEEFRLETDEQVEAFVALSMKT